MSYQVRNQTMKEIWRKFLIQEREKSKPPSATQQTQSIFSEISEFSAGALKFNDSTVKSHFIPLFPYFYCKDVQRDTSSISDLEENKSSSTYQNSNSLHNLELEQIAPPKDVRAEFFNDKKGKNASKFPFTRIQVDFKSAIPLEYTDKDSDIPAKISNRKVDQDYRMQIDFDNIQKIQYFSTCVDQLEQTEQSIYPDEDDKPVDETLKDEKNKQTTLLIYLKRPALFHSKSAKKRCLSPFALP